MEYNCPTESLQEWIEWASLYEAVSRVLCFVR
jgi:hypothetical protein